MKKVFAALESASEITRYEAACDLEDLLEKKPETEVPARVLGVLEAMAFDVALWDELSWLAGDIWAKIIGAGAAVEVAHGQYTEATGEAKVYAAEVLGRHAGQEQLPVLKELSLAEDAQVALHGLRARVALEGVGAREDLQARYDRAEASERGALHDLVLLVTEGIDRIEQIRERLSREEDESVRISALRGLRAEAWRAEAKALVPRVLEIALAPATEDEARAAHDALRSLGDPSVCDALYDLADFEEEEEELCAITVTRLGDPRAVERIIAILEDSWSDEFTRTGWLWELAELVALGDLEPALEERAFQAAMAMASDPDPYVLEFVSPYLAIMRPRDPQVAETLNRLAHEDLGEEAHCAALAALAFDMEPALVREIMWAWSQVEDDPLALEFAASFAMREGDERWVPGLLELVGAPEGWVPVGKGGARRVIDAPPQLALMALGRIATPEAAERVRAVVDARLDAPAPSILQALLFLGDPQDRHRWQALEKAVGKKKGLERSMVLQGLAMCGDSKARDGLEKALDAKVGPESGPNNAAFALAALGHRVAIDQLVATACLFNYHSAELAVSWLGRFARSNLRARQIIDWRRRGDELSKRPVARNARHDSVLTASFVPQNIEGTLV